MSGERVPFNVPRWSLGAPALILLVTLIVVAWGGVNYLTMSRRETPEIKIATALVMTIYPGAGAEKVERQVTRKLEDAFESLENLKKVESISRANISVIFVSVEYDSDTDIEWQKLRSKIAEARASFPSSVMEPEVMDNFGDTTGMIIALEGGDPVLLERVAEDLATELRRIESVGEVSLMGEQPEVVYLEARKADMARHALTPYKVGQMLQMHNLRIPAGAIRTDRYQYRLEPTGEYESERAIGETIIDVSPDTGQILHVKDLFDVRREPRNPPYSQVVVDGGLAMTVNVVMKDGHNIVEMGERVREAIAEFGPRLPAGVGLSVLHDSPRQVDRQIDDFMANLIAGVVIVILSMALFMGLRSAAISAVAIPLSVLIALALMPALAIDLEMVSIAAFIVALGMLVDNSIIVTDNVDVKLRQGMPPAEAAWRGTHELAKPVVVGTLATVVAFMPMLLLSDEMGAFIRSLPLVVAVSLVGSLLVSQTITPLMAKWMMRPSRKPRKDFERTRTAGIYRAFIAGCLRLRWLVLALTVAAVIGGAVLFRLSGFSFFPDAYRDQFSVDIWLKEGSSIEETGRIARLVERALREDPEVASTVTYVGIGGPRFYITVMPEFQTSNYAQVMVNTRSPAVTFGVIDRFNARARIDYPGARVWARKIVMGMPIQAPVEFRISGESLEVLGRLSGEIQDILRSIPGTRQIKDNLGPDVPSLAVDVNIEQANRVGITNTDVALALLSSYEGYELTRFADGDDEIPVVLRLPAEERKIDDDLASLPVASNVTSEKVPLGSVARLEPRWGPGLIRRTDNRRSLTVQAWTDGRLANDIVAEAWPRVRALDLPHGYDVEIGGEKHEMDKSFRELTIVFAVIVVGLIALLVYQLGTMRRTLVVMASVPLATVGAAIGLFVGGYSFSFMAFLGVISLAGMAIKNSVVWIEFVEQARGQGDSIEEAVAKAGIYRLRPIMLTTVTTVGGLFPLALFGGVLFESMAWAIIVGLSLVTIFTLVSIPVLYAVVMPQGR